MFRRFTTLVCLILLVGVALAWMRSLTVQDSALIPLLGGYDLSLRHAGGSFTFACISAGIMVSLPYWLLAAALLTWPLLHLRVRHAEPVKKR